MSSANDTSGLESGPHAVVSADRDGRITAWNKIAEEMLGHKAADAIGLSLDVVIPEEERSDHWRNYRRAMTTGVLNYFPDHVLDVEALRRDGTRVRLGITLVGIHDPAGRLVGVTATMREAK